MFSCIENTIATGSVFLPVSENILIFIHKEFYKMEPFSMLQLLLSENQFELIFPETDNATPSTIRLVYLMNDAVESFLLFHNARLTGTYDPAYEGELDALLTQDENERYALIVHQGETRLSHSFSRI